MSHALLAIQNILQNSNIFMGLGETVLFMPLGKKKVTHFSGLPPTSVSYLKIVTYFLHTDCTDTIQILAAVMLGIFLLFQPFQRTI